MLDDKEIWNSIKNSSLQTKLTSIFGILILIVILNNIPTSHPLLSQELLDDLEYESQFNEYIIKYVNKINDKKVDRTVLKIEGEDNCATLIEMFDRNTGWTSRPILADKILDTCT